MLRSWIFGILRGLCADDGWTEDATQRAKLYVQVGVVLRAHGEPDAALVHLRKGLATHEAAAEAELECVAGAHHEVGFALMEKAEHDAALESYRRRWRSGR